MMEDWIYWAWFVLIGWPVFVGAGLSLLAVVCSLVIAWHDG